MNKMIKKIITACFLLCLWSPFSVYSDQSYLSTEDETGLLIDINNRCQDVWCEGGYDFDFHTFECSFDEGECFFGFDYIKWRQTEGLFEAGCVIYANSIDVLFENDHSYRMSQSLYRKIDSCITGHSAEARDYFLSLEE